MQPSEGTIDRRAYEIAVIVHLRERLGAGSIWVDGSRAYRTLDDYLLPTHHPPHSRLPGPSESPRAKGRKRYFFNSLDRFSGAGGEARHCAVVAAMFDRRMTTTNLLVPTYQHMLQTLSGLLDKAHQQMPDQTETLLAARLAADMFPLAAQVRFAAFQAQEAVFRLRGERVPEWLDAIAAEGRNAGEAPGTVLDAKERIDAALSFLTEVSGDALDAGADLPIAIELPGGITFDMTGEQYARDWALPQFYFHVITAYAILRAQGVEIGKADYVPHMFAYLRPGTMPAA